MLHDKFPGNNKTTCTRHNDLNLKPFLGDTVAMSSSEPELVRAKASFKLWKEGQRQDRDLRMIVGHFSVLAGVDSALQRRSNTVKKGPRRLPPCRLPGQACRPNASYENTCTNVEVAVVEPDDAVDGVDDNSDDNSADDSSDDSSDDTSDDMDSVTEEPIEVCRILQEDVATEVDTPNEKVESVQHGALAHVTRQEKNAAASSAEISSRNVSPTTCERHLRSPSLDSLYGAARRYGRLLTSVRRREGVSWREREA